jgi:hypothetical protein
MLVVNIERTVVVAKIVSVSAVYVTVRVSVIVAVTSSVPLGTIVVTVVETVKKAFTEAVLVL